MSKPGTEANVPMPEIVETPDVLGGKPRIEGHRIGVHHVVELVIHGEYAVEDVASTVYPHLSTVEVHAALEYYYRHRERIEVLLDSRQSREDELVGSEDVPFEES